MWVRFEHVRDVGAPITIIGNIGLTNLLTVHNIRFGGNANRWVTWFAEYALVTVAGTEHCRR